MVGETSDLTREWSQRRGSHRKTDITKVNSSRIEWRNVSELFYHIPPVLSDRRE